MTFTWQLGHRQRRQRRDAKVACVLSKAAATRCWNWLGLAAGACGTCGTCAACGLIIAVLTVGSGGGLLPWCALMRWALLAVAGDCGSWLWAWAWLNMEWWWWWWWWKAKSAVLLHAGATLLTVWWCDKLLLGDHQPIGFSDSCRLDKPRQMIRSTWLTNSSWSLPQLGYFYYWSLLPRPGFICIYRIYRPWWYKLYVLNIFR